MRILREFDAPASYGPPMSATSISAAIDTFIDSKDRFVAHNAFDIEYALWNRNRLPLEVTADRKTALKLAQENFLLYSLRQCQQHKCEMKYYIIRRRFGTFRCPRNKTHTSGRPAGALFMQTPLGANRKSPWDFNWQL